ncbi:hypothetical protein RB195_006129 [Necator americanus]|uniref:Cuticlin N-terminal domain-containing protein n=1 Tax=Necator americanus TaxID=51031 RepID=A0ABR1BSY2_NECAM
MHPRGVSFSFSLVVSFHHYFVTGMDRAFHIRCFFLESVKNLHTEFSVGTLKTEVVEQEFQLPECIYQLRDGINGPTLQYAQPPVCDHDSNYLPGVTPPHHDIDSPSIGPTFDIPFPRGSLYSRNHFEKDYLLHKIAIYLGGEGEPEENAMYNEFPPESKPFFGPIDPMDGYGR